MYHEFMELAGYEVSYETYSKVIEPMYMALPDGITKQEFVGMLDRRAFALPSKRQVLRQMKQLAQFLYENCGRSSYWDEKEQLEQLSKEYAKRFWGLDWSSDLECYVYFTTGYEYPTVQRGCTYPRELVIGRGHHEYERLMLVRE